MSRKIEQLHKKIYSDSVTSRLRTSLMLKYQTSFTHTALPIVEINVVLNASSENLNNTHVLPTPESPIKSNLNK